MKLSGAMLLVLLAVSVVSHTSAASEYTGDISSSQSMLLQQLLPRQPRMITASGSCGASDWTCDLTSTSSVKISSRPCQIYKNGKTTIVPLHSAC